MTDYDTDFSLWGKEQAAKLRAATLTELDRENIARELDGLARALRREFADRLVRPQQNLAQLHLQADNRLPTWCVAIQEERSKNGGKRHEMPWRHTLDAYLHAYLDGTGIGADPKGALFRTIPRGTGQFSDTPLPQANAYAMVQRRAFATGITAYLKNGGTLENAAAMANHESTWPTGDTTRSSWTRWSGSASNDEVRQKSEFTHAQLLRGSGTNGAVRPTFTFNTARSQGPLSRCNGR